MAPARHSTLAIRLQTIAGPRAVGTLPTSLLRMTTTNAGWATALLVTTIAAPSSTIEITVASSAIAIVSATVSGTASYITKTAATVTATVNAVLHIAILTVGTSAGHESTGIIRLARLRRGVTHRLRAAPLCHATRLSHARRRVKSCLLLQPLHYQTLLIGRWLLRPRLVRHPHFCVRFLPRPPLLLHSLLRYLRLFVLVLLLLLLLLLIALLLLLPCSLPCHPPQPLRTLRSRRSLIVMTTHTRTSSMRALPYSPAARRPLTL